CRVVRAIFDDQIPALIVSGIVEPLQESGLNPLASKQADARHSPGGRLAGALLRAHRKRPRDRRTADTQNEIPARDHSIISSARRRIDCGTVMPSAFAVLRLITSSNLVGCCTGRSAGLAPVRILPA